jgi:hypothetical protein
MTLQGQEKGCEEDDILLSVTSHSRQVASFEDATEPRTSKTGDKVDMKNLKRIRYTVVQSSKSHGGSKQLAVEQHFSTAASPSSAWYFLS